MIGMSGVPARMKDGMLVLSGDVLLLFNPLQIDAPALPERPPFLLRRTWKPEKTMVYFTWTQKGM